MRQEQALQARVLDARLRSVAWLDSMQMPDAPAGVARISGAHDPRIWPGMLLPGTYNAVMCRQLLGALPADGARAASWILRHRRQDGVFRIPGMTEDAVFKKPDRDETWRYIDFHVTNYCLGALQALTPDMAPVVEFAHPWLDPLTLKAWLADRDLRDPWQEGNNIVNLAGFLMLLPPSPAVDRALEIILTWHDYHQNPATGFWGVGQSSDITRALHAMAGSMHNFHIWYAIGRTLPYQERAIDYALSQPPIVESACIDVDLVDLLVHGHMMTAYRRTETVAWLRRMLQGLLASQNEDGGFCDELHGVRRQDGWVRGYSEPQGISNGFATWFRWIAIAMISDLLWPGLHPWQFRRMIGIGYRRAP